MSWRAALFLIIAVSALLAGCDGANQARKAARHAQHVNELKQLGLALHNYHQGIGGYPTGVTAPAVSAPADEPVSASKPPTSLAPNESTP
jgi:hypothetical protein